MHPTRPASTPLSAGGLEAQARADLAAGRWRKARDAFKELCKRDRRAFQPLLIEANVGLVRDMLAKGLVGDARQVVAYLKSFAPAESIARLELEIAAAASPAAKSAPDPVALLAGRSLMPAESQRLADQLVVAFGGADLDVGTPERAQVVGDLHAIHQAIEAACGGDHDAALELVRPLRRESPFAHWRLFVRGVVAFQRNDDEKAARNFAELPLDSVPRRARDAWLLAMGERGDAEGNPSEMIVEAAAALTGNAGWGRVLTKAEALWRARKHGASYRSVRDARKPFPSDGIDLSGVLTEFYFNALFALGQDERATYEDALYDLEIDGRAKNSTERKLVRRTIALRIAAEGGAGTEPDEFRRTWEAFLHEHERAHGANPRLASAAFAWLGAALSGPPSPSPFALDTRKSVSPAAIAALEKSIAVDPANSRAHVLLCNLLHDAKRTGDRNRLLDVMAERFPYDKDVLLAAGAGCLDRKAFMKAVSYYERALAIDRLDPATPDHLVTAYLALARQHYSQRRLTDGRGVLDLADSHAVDAPENLVRSRWSLAARRGVMETIFANAAPDVVLAEARAAAPSAATFLFFARLAWSFYDARGVFPSSLQTELDRAAGNRPTAREAGTLLEVMLYWTRGSNSRAQPKAESWLKRYLKAAARQPFTREDAAFLLERLRTLPAFQGEARAFTTRVLKRDRKDPLFRLYDDLLQPFPMMGPEEYEAILAEARRRGDTAAEALAREAMGELAMRRPVLVSPWDDEDEGPDPFDYAPGPIGGLPAIGSPDEQAAIAAIVALLANTPESEIAYIRKHGAMGLPLELFDIVVELAQSGLPFPGMPNQRKRRQGRPRSNAP